MALTTPGNLKTNYLNNALHSVSRFSANFVKVGIKGREPGKELWVRNEMKCDGEKL